VNLESAKCGGLYQSYMTHCHKLQFRQADRVRVGVITWKEWGTDNLALNCNCARSSVLQQGNE
jgi:hypothetical protein